MVKNLSRLCWKMQVLTRGLYCIVFFKSFLKRPVILDAVWGFPELHDLVKKEESIVELLYTTSRRGKGGGGCSYIANLNFYTGRLHRDV